MQVSAVWCPFKTCQADLLRLSLCKCIAMLQSRKWGSVHVPIKPLWWLCLFGQGPWIVSALDTNWETHCRICRDANVGVSLGSPTGHSSCGTWPSSAPGGWSDWPGWRPQDLGNKSWSYSATWSHKKMPKLRTKVRQELQDRFPLPAEGVTGCDWSIDLGHQIVLIPSTNDHTALSYHSYRHLLACFCGSRPTLLDHQERFQLCLDLQNHKTWYDFHCFSPMFFTVCWA